MLGEPETTGGDDMSIDEVLSGAATHYVACERAESFIGRLPDGCVSLMTLDFPYYGVKDDAWDNAWESPEAFIAWMGGVLAPCRRVLAPNGSIYVFAAPQVRGGLTMATRVECEVAQHFSVLQRITWQKPPGSTKAEMFEKDTCRAFFPVSEVIIFAEQPGADLLALGESQYGAKCDEIRGFVFEPLRAYFDAERKRSGLRSEQIQAGMFTRTGARYVFDRHTFSRSQWELPTAEQYAAARDLFNAEGNPEGRPYLREQYEALREQYEALREQYEALRRPFSVSADVPYTDVWTYRTVNTYPGKHPCEKPAEMARDIVRASSRPGDVVADFFCGSGAFLAAAVAEGRRAIGCDMDAHWAEQAQRRCDAAKVTGRVVRTAPRPKDDRQGDLFAR
jgi:site-specific DNA-methyltransferase (adenine-specific)